MSDEWWVSTLQSQDTSYKNMRYVRPPGVPLTATRTELQGARPPFANLPGRCPSCGRARPTLALCSRRTSRLYVHVIRHQMTFLDPALSLLRQTTKYFAQLTANMPEYSLLPVLRNEYNVVLTLPAAVASTLVLSHVYSLA